MSSEVSPTERHLYSLDLNSNMTQRLTQDEGYYSSICSSNADLAIISYSGPNVPYQALYNLSGSSITQIKVLSDNSNLKQLLSTYSLPQKVYVKIPTKNNYELNAYYMLPPDVMDGRKYGLLLNVYGGPGSQTVTKQWSLSFNEYIASNLNIIVASVDGRGTGARGLEFMQNTYLNLGIHETEDQIEAAKYLSENLLSKYVDKEKVGIWGWSYGGFMTLNSLSRGNDVFKAGISVAPVTDWRYYDSVYTERYMSTPLKNLDGYNKTSILNIATNLRDVKLLLIHGTGDDNVHFQNSVELNKVLIKNNIQYETMYYCNSAHSISTYGARKHLYQLISTFLSKHF